MNSAKRDIIYNYMSLLEKSKSIEFINRCNKLETLRQLYQVEIDNLYLHINLMIKYYYKYINKKDIGLTYTPIHCAILNKCKNIIHIDLSKYVKITNYNNFDHNIIGHLIIFILSSYLYVIYDINKMNLTEKQMLHSSIRCILESEKYGFKYKESKNKKFIDHIMDNVNKEEKIKEINDEYYSDVLPLKKRKIDNQ